MNIQIHKIIKTSVVMLALTCLCAGNAFAQKAVSNKTADEFSSVKLYWQERSAQEWSKRLTTVAELIGVKVEPMRLVEVLSESGGLGNWQPLREDSSHLMFKILPAHDELRFVNSQLAESTDGLTIEEQEAVKVAGDMLQKMHERDLLNGLKYNPEPFKIGYHQIGSGSMDGKQTKQTVVGYRVTYLANIDGIPLANAGVRIAVHRSGKISGIRIGGVSASETAAKNLERKVSNDEIQKQFQTSIPSGMKPRIAWQQLMYVMPDNERSAVVEPTHTISYSLAIQSEQGEVISRRKTVGFSLVDASVGVIDYLKPTDKHQSVKVSRDAKKDDSINRKVKEQDKHPH